MTVISSDFKKFILRFVQDMGLDPEPAVFLPLKGDGSLRCFWRVVLAHEDPTYIVMTNNPKVPGAREENFAYLMIGRHLKKKGIPVPVIYRHELERGWFIIEDMGETSLQSLVAGSRDYRSIYKKVLDELFRLQIQGVSGFDPAWCCQTETYDRVVMRKYEADYFREAFLFRYLGLKEEWPELEGPFEHLADLGSETDLQLFMHRDFQSRNLMIKDGSIGIIDWQGGRLGPPGYDLASLIIDPYTDLVFNERHQIYKDYLEILKEHNYEWAEDFEHYFPYLALQRNLQILGAFSHLARVKGKSYFEEYIPTALQTLRHLLICTDDPDLTALTNLVEDLFSRKIVK